MQRIFYDHVFTITPIKMLIADTHSLVNGVSEFKKDAHLFILLVISQKQIIFN